MKDNHDDPLEEIISEFRRIPIPDTPDHLDVLSRLGLPRVRDVGSSSAPSLRLRSLLMRPTFRYFSAAVFLLAALAWLTLSLSGSVALAEVLKATEQHKLVRFHLREITALKAADVHEREITGYADLVTPRLRLEFGSRMTLNKVIEYTSVVVKDYQRDRFLLLTSHRLVVDEERALDKSQAKVIRMVKERGLATKKAYPSRIKRENNRSVELGDLVNGRPLLDTLREFQDHTDTLPTKAELDGQSVLIYRLRKGNEATSLWVDPRTKLPLRIEIEKDHPYPQVAREQRIYTHFEWDPKVSEPEQLFSTEPPTGYTLEDHPTAPTARPIDARAREAGSPSDRALLEKLEAKVPLQFPNEIPLDDVLKYIGAATRGPGDAGIPFAFDEDSMKLAGRARTSLVTIDVKDEPLKTSLRKLLKPLGLTYDVEGKAVTIRSEPVDGKRKP